MARVPAGSNPGKNLKSDVDAWLAGIPVEQRSALERLRRSIRDSAPAAEEGFSYGLPAFRLNGRPLACYGASKEHCSFFPMSPAVIAAHAAELRKYELSKGTIRFTPEKPLPSALVRKIIRARIRELTATGRGR